ncbi:putative cadmium resistance transporter [Phlegmacium glaucopus]|nr:putative cadmium resistance transporter [Phlegmacium glaucopus]
MPIRGFGKAVGVACASFAITNIDDMFILITFFSESTTSKTLTPWRIVLGQYIGFTVIVTISLIGFGVSFLFATEPIGFMGFLPLLLGVWKALNLIPAFKEAEEDDTSSIAGVRSVLKVAVITVVNGGDGIGIYVPLFSQTHKINIAIYVIVYYILLGFWCLIAFLFMKQKHILALAQKYIRVVIPLLYIGVGLYIVINSSCYPWSIQEINLKISTHPGKVILSVVTTFFLVISIGVMVWVKLVRRRKLTRDAGAQSLGDNRNAVSESPLGEIPLPTQVEVSTIEESSASTIKL